MIGKVLGTLFFLVFLIMGCGFAVVVVADAFREAEVWFWPEVPCTVVSSGVEKTGDDSQTYRPTVRFTYRIDGRAFESERVSRTRSSTTNYDRARRPSDQYPPGSRATCRVDPDQPGVAVLEPRMPWTALLVFFPLIFVVIGGGGIFAIWKGIPKLHRARPKRSISQRARTTRNLGRRIELVVGGVFAAVGAGFSIFLLVIPGFRLIAAAGWNETPATIIESTLRSWSTDDGMSYSADVVYRYEAGGRSWISNRLTFFPMGSSSSDHGRETVEQHPAGTATTCFVDPKDPSRSVLDNSFRPVYLIGLFPLAFLVAGAALTGHALRARPASGLGEAPADGEPEIAAAQRLLEARTGPVAKVAGMLFIALFWNGIVSVFVYQAIDGFASGRPDYFLTVFLVPFVLVGLGLVAGVVYTLLASVNPRPRLVISPPSPRLGTVVRLNWTFAGRVDRIRALEIVLEGYEKATYRRGTDTVTDRDAFASYQLIDTSIATQIAAGSAEVAIPEDTMHSFVSANNAIIWSLMVRGDIERWPDVAETFDIEIRPMAPEELRS